MYTLFLFLFMTAEFIPTLPEYLHELAKYALLFFIPLIVAANELGSFVDISYREPLSPRSPQPRADVRPFPHRHNR